MNCDDINKVESFQHQALEVREPGEYFDPNNVPQNGDEFLTRMLYERSKCPAIVHIKQKKTKKYAEVLDKETVRYIDNMKHLQQATVPASNLLPTLEWKKQQEHMFQVTRSKIIIYRSQNKEYLKANVEYPISNSSEDWKKFCINNPALVSTILSFGQRRLESLLANICQWLDEILSNEDIEHEQNDTQEPMQILTNKNENIVAMDCEAMPNNIDDKNTVEVGIAKADNKNLDTSININLAGNERWLGSWMYATLVCLETPLEAHVISTLRNIARNLVLLRGQLESKEESNVAPFNLLIFLISKIFSQFDFMDFV